MAGRSGELLREPSGRTVVRVLGPIEVWHGQQRAVLAGQRQRAVLARLVIARGSVVPADVLIDNVWHSQPPPSAQGTLQAHVSTLRRVLEPGRRLGAPPSVLLSRASGYALHVETDADRFEELVKTAENRIGLGRHAEAAEALDQALALWHGEPFADLRDQLWLEPEVARLIELQLAAREERLAIAVSVGELHTAVPALQRLVEAQPLREEVWRLLALALYRSGRQAAALAALRQARSVLLDELGLDLDPRLRDLEVAILQHAPELDTPQTAGVGRMEPSVVPTQHPRPGEPKLVGRDTEQQLIASAALRATRGEPQFAIITGEPGIGKTWLAEAVAQSLTTEGWQTAWGRCLESAGAPAMWPWLEILDRLSQIAPLPSALASMRDGGFDVPPGQVGEARFQQHLAFRDYLGQVVEHDPLLLIIDDVQWADSASVALLGTMPDLVRNLAMLVLVTARSGVGERLNSEVFARLGRHETLRIGLRGLTPTHVEELVHTSGVQLDAAELATRTGGNPFLLRETLKLVRSRGSTAGLAEVPAAAADLLRQPFRQLPAEWQAVMSLAAVYGLDIDEAVLRTAGNSAPEAVTAALDAATASGILTWNSEVGLRFVHDLVRQTILDDLAPLARARLHAAIAQAIEERPGTDPATVAAHAVAAGPTEAERALRWTVAAAEQSSRRLAYDDAVRWWNLALAAHQQRRAADPTEYVELLLRLVSTQLKSSDLFGAEMSRRAAVEAAQFTEDRLLYARALTALDVPGSWAFRHYGDIDVPFVEHLETALTWTDLPDTIRARLLATLSDELSYGDPHRRRALSTESVNIARAVGDPSLIGFCLIMRDRSLDTLRSADRREAKANAEELLRLYADQRHARLALIGHLSLVLACQRSFELAAAEQHAAEVSRLATRLGEPIIGLQHQLWHCNWLLLQGRADEALTAIEAVFGARGFWASGAFASAVKTLALLHAQRLGDAAPLLGGLRSFHPAMARDAETLMLLQRGRRDAAVALAATSPPPIPDDWVAPTAYMLRGLAAAECGTFAQQQAARTALLPASGTLVVTGALDGGPADLVLGRLATAMGNITDALMHFQLLERLASDAQMPHWVSRAREEQLRPLV